MHLRGKHSAGTLDQSPDNSSPWPLRGITPTIMGTQLSETAGGGALGLCGRATRSLRALHRTWRLRLLGRSPDRFVLRWPGSRREFLPAMLPCRCRWYSLFVEPGADCQPDYGGRTAFLTSRRGMKGVPHSLVGLKVNGAGRVIGRASRHLTNPICGLALLKIID